MTHEREKIILDIIESILKNSKEPIRDLRELFAQLEHASDNE